MRERIHLVIIDPQNDFCDLPAACLPSDQTKPALPVAGAHADMLRVAALIDAAGAGLSDISITLDSHQHIDIGHPTFWRQADGSAVAPFTPITLADVSAGRYMPRLPNALPRVLAYLERLEAAGRYTHMVWPVHCEIGAWGHNVHPAVRAAYNRWEEATLNSVNKVIKGANPWTEHYSAIQAEVPDPADPDTETNAGFIALLRAADRVLIAGEAGSHCVKATTEHLADAFGPNETGKLILLTDCISPVAGFETQYAQFLADMRACGLQTAKSSDLLIDLFKGLS
ncbi:MAG: cysteine hydrolase [Betaproteobacteria bacterium]|nr:cysteine hydrolase [Betaproteobacteria bacterium]